jgi:NAD(P)-dependent dehydrogenase (short-subunit alcohol dehydrogenase family)
MDMKIQGLRVLVTAGASGIGLATARAFLLEGARVFICDVDRAALAAVASSDPALGQIDCDVADPVAVDRLFAAATAALGGLDTLVNNAGIAGPTAACEEVALPEWERTLAVNLTSHFLCAQRAIPLLKASANASIANLSSAAGRFGFPLRTPYAAAKWGVIGLTKSLAIELGPFGVRVNAVCPGSVAGPRIDRVFAHKAAARGVAPDVVRDEALARTSLRRLVTADDIANAIVFLASPRGANVSGQLLPIDADTHALV